MTAPSLSCARCGRPVGGRSLRAYDRLGDGTAVCAFEDDCEFARTVADARPASFGLVDNRRHGARFPQVAMRPAREAS